MSYTRSASRNRPAALRTWLALVIALLAFAACDTSPDTPSIPPPPEDSVRTDTLGAVSVPLPAPPRWRIAEAGPFLGIAGVTTRTAVLVLPEYADSTLHELSARDPSRMAPLPVELFARRGKVSNATIVGAQSRGTDSCVEWPTAEVRLPDGNVSQSWTVAIAAGYATAIPLDSIESLASADSARLAAEVARLASMAPGDTATAFEGIPYVVRSARRFQLDDSTEGISALVVRRISSEAMPLAEHVFMVAERDRNRPRAPWQLAYTERAIGTEESVQLMDVLAALRLGDSSRPSLVVARDFGSRVTYSLLERQAEGRWVVRWSSATVGC
ncbi:MAG TPA: hypothetical protein VKZ41_03095 [Gemmatimonadales bacterium]|nr:hypothetical protein [Gemmatimonadales bacterium]